MKQITFNGTIGEKKFFLRRVDKRKARNLFEKGVKIYLVPSNLYPFGPWVTPFEISTDDCHKSDFDLVSNTYSNYHCINNQTGYFPSFYINTLKP
jgi:hypothetical protein